MPIHTMTCLVLTAVAVLWLVIGLTVIGTVFLPLQALDMGHNAAVDLAAAVRWKPCNSNFPCLPFSSSVWTLTWSFMSWVNFMTLWPLKPGQPPTCDFRNTWLSMRKWALHSSFQRTLLVFFTDTCIYPTAVFSCCWPSALRESSVWSQHPSWQRPHIYKHGHSSGEVAYTDSLLPVTENTYLIMRGSTQCHHSNFDTPRIDTHHLPTRTHIDKEPKARDERRHMDPHVIWSPATYPSTHTSPDTPGRK